MVPFRAALLPKALLLLVLGSATVRAAALPAVRADGPELVCLVLGVTWAVWHLPLFFVDGTVQHDLGLATPSGILFVAGNVPMAMLVTAAHERAGIVASIGVHFAVNATMILLDVHEPVVQALIIGVQLLTVTALLLTRRTAPRTPKPAPARP